MAGREAYSVLGLPTGSDMDVVRARYRQLVREMHPDGTNPNADALQDVIVAFRLIDRWRGAPDRAAHRAAHRTAQRTAQRTSHRAAQHTSAQPAEDAGRSTARILTLGRVAIGNGTTAVRVNAIRILARSGSRSAGVYVRQALFDPDAEVARAAAAAVAVIPGARRERQLIELFDDLTESQRLEIVRTLGTHSERMDALLAYAAADSAHAVREAAAAVLAEKGSL